MPFHKSGDIEPAVYYNRTIQHGSEDSKCTNGHVWTLR